MENETVIHALSSKPRTLQAGAARRGHGGGGRTPLRRRTPSRPGSTRLIPARPGIYIYIYIYVYVYIYIYIYIYIYLYILIYLYVFIYIYIYILDLLLFVPSLAPSQAREAYWL